MSRRVLFAALSALALISSPVLAEKMHECVPPKDMLEAAPNVAAMVGAKWSVDAGEGAAQLVAALQAVVPDKAHVANIILAFHKDGEAMVYFADEGGFCHVEHLTADEVKRLLAYITGQDA
jgi:hypothetical protein